MRGITIITDTNTVHTGYDLDLVQEVRDIGAPEVQSYLVEVPGRNGLLNLTKGLTGSVTYKNRTLKFQYLGSGNREDLLEVETLFKSYHGEVIQVVDDDTPNYYYEGEASVNTKWSNNLLTITLEVNANPFMERLELTSISCLLATTTKDMTVTNEGVDVCPIVKVDGTASIQVGTDIYTLDDGEYTIRSFLLKHGNNLLRVTGSGTLTIKYREARV